MGTVCANNVQETEEKKTELKNEDKKKQNISFNINSYQNTENFCRNMTCLESNNVTEGNFDYDQFFSSKSKNYKTENLTVSFKLREEMKNLKSSSNKNCNNETYSINSDEKFSRKNSVFDNKKKR